MGLPTLGLNKIQSQSIPILAQENKLKNYAEALVESLDFS